MISILQHMVGNGMEVRIVSMDSGVGRIRIGEIIQLMVRDITSLVVRNRTSIVVKDRLSWGRLSSFSNRPK